MKHKNKLLYIAIVLCIMMAARGLHQAHYRYWPVAEPGECLLLEIPENNYSFKLMIEENSFKYHASLAQMQVQFLPDLTFSAPIQITYEELRDLEARKVSCDPKSLW